MLLGIPNNKNDHLKTISYWLKRNPATCFRYVEGRLKHTIIGLSQLKIAYPNVRFITTINDPWHQLFHIYKNYINLTKKFINLKQFVQLVALDPTLCPSILDDYPLDDSIIILRNEYIETDFAKFSKSSNAGFTLTSPVDYRKLFDEESNNLICSIYQNDISFFYPELLN
jgi:hypothetical protein